MNAQKRLGKNYCKDPMQYTCLISFTPSANKPGELHRINTLAIEIGSYLTKHNSSYFKLQTCPNDCSKNRLGKNYCDDVV